jgi:hypothetical protein
MVKVNGSVVLNETCINYVEHIFVCVKRDLYCSVDPLYRKIFPVLTVTNW